MKEYDLKGSYLQILSEYSICYDDKAYIIFSYTLRLFKGPILIKSYEFEVGIYELAI